MQPHSSMEDLLAPLSHTSNQLDGRLSWHLAQSLAAINYQQTTRLCSDSLHDTYATQLQSLGASTSSTSTSSSSSISANDMNDMWHWSVFVLMHVRDEKRREACVRAYLAKYASSASELSESELFLVDKLQVPRVWLYEYKAMKAKYKREHVHQLELLLKAHKWNEAHLLLVDVLAPDLFLKRESSLPSSSVLG